MAKIYLSYSHKDAEFARDLAEGLKQAGHQILVDAEVISAGQNWRQTLSQGLKEAEAFLVLLSNNSLTSQYTLMEIGSARAYSQDSKKMLLIPVAIDAIQVPIALQDIQILFAPDRNIDRIINEVNRSLSHFIGQQAATEVAAEETAKRIETNAATYIEEAIVAQQNAERVNKRSGQVWYLVGFVALLSGIGFALYTLGFRAQSGELISAIATLITNVIVIGLLGACAKYAFSLGKSYTTESLKSADRIHAILFGKFYLRAFGQKATWSEIKEVFQHWNIDRSSTFAALDPSQIDPQILTLIGNIASAIRGGTKEK